MGSVSTSPPTATPILQPGQLEAALGDLPELRLPPQDLFLDRERRFRQLAEGHVLADWLRFLAALSQAQHEEFARLDGLAAPDAGLLARCQEHAMPPLAPPAWHRDPAWQGVAQRLGRALRPAAPAALHPALDRLEHADPAWLEAQAERVLAGQTQDLDLALAPVLGAALQTCWTRLASRLEPHRIARPAYPNLCPVCGSHPVASVVRIGGAENGLRYLHCALCSSEWHLVRARCSNCDNGKDIAYYSLEGGNGAVRAETCPACHGYLKLMRQDQDPHIDPVADDLASLALDILMDEEGYARSGMNLLLAPSGPEEQP